MAQAGPGVNRRHDAFIEVNFKGQIRSSKYPTPRFDIGSDLAATPSNDPNRNNHTLAADMWQAFQNQTGADLKIICKYQCLSKLCFESYDTCLFKLAGFVDEDTNESKDEEVIFMVQKGILTSRSEVFMTMFQHNFAESATSTLTISDMSPPALKEMLR